MLRCFAPVSIGNFIVGFDVLGAALAAVDGEPFGDIVGIAPFDGFAFDLTGSHAHYLPGPAADNLVVRCDVRFHQALAARGIAARGRRLTLEKRLPVGSGLGSSGSSIVAALGALNAFYEAPFTQPELLLLAGEMEAQVSGGIHYDNVAPSLLGGLQLMLPDAARVSEALPFFADWLAVVHYPGITVETRLAREILPKAYPLAVVTAYWQRLAGVVHGLYRQDRDLVASLLHDPMIEPHRAALVPGLPDARRAALAAGALAFGLSGSGPTCFALVDSLAKAETVRTAIEAAMPPQPTRFTRICRIDPQGARLV